MRILVTGADITNFKKEFNFTSTNSIEQGVLKFVDWYKKYYSIKD